MVAEGISEAHLIGATRNAGCTHLQGYFYSKPIEAGEVPGYFAHPEQTAGREPGTPLAAVA